MTRRLFGAAEATGDTVKTRVYTHVSGSVTGQRVHSVPSDVIKLIRLITVPRPAPVRDVTTVGDYRGSWREISSKGSKV